QDLPVLIPESLAAVTSVAELTIVDYERYQTVKASPEEAISLLKDDKLHRWMKSANVELPMMALLNNYDGQVWRVNEMVQMLANQEARHGLVREVVEYAVEGHQSGIVVDFESIPDPSQANFREFVSELGSALHGVGLKLMVELPARDDSYDYKLFGKECDPIVLLNFDQHWVSSPPGPIAAQDWFVENLRQVLQVVPAQKIVVGVANFAYDWPQAANKKWSSAT